MIIITYTGDMSQPTQITWAEYLATQPSNGMDCATCGQTLYWCDGHGA